MEDVNLRLKNEIQRLTTEKLNLEKLLGDPNHRASCRHTPRCAKALRPPLVIVTPAESPDTTSSSSSPSSTTSSTSSLGSPTSPPLPESGSYKLPPPTPTAAPPPPPLSQPRVSVSTPLTSLPSSSSSSIIMSCAPSSSSSSSASLSSSSQFLAPKYSATQNSSQRHHPYQIPPGRGHQSPAVEGEKQQYASPNSSSSCHLKSGYIYPCMGVAPRTHEFILPNPPSQKSVYTTPKSRSTNVARYNPYAGRPPSVPSPLSTHTHPQPGTLTCGDTYIQSNNNSGCGREDQQSFVTDMHTNQFFPPCSYSSM